jgi:hypothetical protein
VRFVDAVTIDFADAVTIDFARFMEIIGERIAVSTPTLRRWTCQRRGTQRVNVAQCISHEPSEWRILANHLER